MSYRQFIVLSPSTDVPSMFRTVTADPIAHRNYLDVVQKMRGRIYATDGAIEALDERGRHVHSADPLSLHLLSLSPNNELCSCARFLPYHGGLRFDDLLLSDAAICHDPVWGNRLRQSMELTAKEAAQQGILLAEVGGWAVEQRLRGTSEALRLVLTMFALGTFYGRTMAICTATTRHSSSHILKRLGARAAQWNGEDLPSYYDPAYGCRMEVLLLDSARPSERHASGIHDFAKKLQNAPVIASSAESGINSILNLAVQLSIAEIASAEENDAIGTHVLDCTL